MNAQGRKNDKPEKVRVCTFSLSKKAMKEEEKSCFRKNESKMANFVEIFHTDFPHMHTNTKSHENICLKDFSILALFVT